MFLTCQFSQRLDERGPIIELPGLAVHYSLDPPAAPGTIAACLGTLHPQPHQKQL